VSELDLLSPFQTALAEVEERHPELLEIVERWATIKDAEVPETKEAREARLLEFLQWACGVPELLSGGAQNLEEISHVLFFFLDELEINDVKEEMFQALSDLFTGIQNLPDTQLEMCSILLNLIPRTDDVASSRRPMSDQEAHNRRWGNCKGRVFTRILQFAITVKRGDLFRGRLSKKLYQRWYLEEELYTNLLWSSYQLLRQTRGAKEEAHQFLLEYLRKRPQERSSNAWEAVVHVLASHENSPRALMEVYSLDAVRRLQDIPSFEPVYRLLDLLYQGNVTQYQEFLAVESNRTNVEDLGLDPSDLLFKIQQLTLCDLGREQPLQDLGQLTELLVCENLDQLERVVQAAQQQGLLDALFDYSNNTLRLHKVALRVFTNNADSWEKLASQLDKWSVQTSTIVNYSGQKGM